mmetsp:Transcript_14140/g.25215  ORF Transcript_14140/g.25215 Transcript_14140/m.25215 type:complete len:215 (-) Transcript_14140:1074-1718(-)
MFSTTLAVAIVVIRRIRHFSTKSSGPLILIVLLSFGTWMRIPLNSSSSLAILLPPLPMTPPFALSSTLNLQTATPSPPFKKHLISSKAADTLPASPRASSTFLLLRNDAFTLCLFSTWCKMESDPPMNSKGCSSEATSSSAMKFFARKSFNNSDACLIFSFVPFMTSSVSSVLMFNVQPSSEHAFLMSFPGSPSKNPIIPFSIGILPVWFSAII